MSNENIYEVSLSGTTSKTVNIEILDTRWTIQDILRAEEFPIHTWPCGDNDWAYITIDGIAVARWYIGEADLVEEVEFVVGADGKELELELGG